MQNDLQVTHCSPHLLSELKNDDEEQSGFFYTAKNGTEELNAAMLESALKKEARNKKKRYSDGVSGNYF